MDKGVLIILYANQGGKCYYCDCSLLTEAEEGRNPNFDHIDPKGGDDIRNLCLACDWCNSAKKDKTFEEFKEYIRPYLEGKVEKQDLSAYKKYRELDKKFKLIK